MCVYVFVYEVWMCKRERANMWFGVYFYYRLLKYGTTKYILHGANEINVSAPLAAEIFMLTPNQIAIEAK